MEELKRTLYNYEISLKNQTSIEVINLMKPILNKLKQEIIEAYPWTEEEIIEKINSGKVPDEIAYCYN